MAIVADLGSLQRLPSIISAGHLAELAYTAKDISAERAKEIGLVNDVAADAEGVLKAAHALAAEIAANSPIAVQGTKAVLAANEGKTVAEGLDYVATWNAGHARLGRPHRGGHRVHGEAHAQVHRALARSRAGLGLRSSTAAGAPPKNEPSPRLMPLA